MDGPKNYTPLERLLMTAAPVAAICVEVVTATKAGQGHELGAYRAKESAIITKDSQKTYQLVGIQIPLQMAEELAAALFAAEETPLGQQLATKVKGMLREMAEAEVSAPPPCTDATGRPS